MLSGRAYAHISSGLYGDNPMPKGGYRAAAGRPPGPLLKRTAGRPPGSRNKKTLAKLPTNMSGIEYLHAVVNDKEADVTRRDRAAGILASIEARRGIAPGKKQQAALEAQWSGYGTDWWDILHRDGEVPSSSPPLSLEPEIRAKALAEQQRQQR